MIKLRCSSRRMLSFRPCRVGTIPIRKPRAASSWFSLIFTLVAYAYLGAPRTTRQSRNLSLLGSIGVVALLRFVGFATTVIAVNMPLILVLHYLLLATAAGLSIWAIGRGIIIEPPAFISNAVTALQQRFAPRLA